MLWSCVLQGFHERASASRVSQVASCASQLCGSSFSCVFLHGVAHCAPISASTDPGCLIKRSHAGAPVLHCTCSSIHLSPRNSVCSSSCSSGELRKAAELALHQECCRARSSCSGVLLQFEFFGCLHFCEELLLLLELLDASRHTFLGHAVYQAWFLANTLHFQP